MATAVRLDLSDELAEALDREIASGNYASRDELVQRAIERLLEGSGIDPATEWGGRTGLELLGEASQRLPYDAEESSSRPRRT